MNPAEDRYRVALDEIVQIAQGVGLKSGGDPLDGASSGDKELACRIRSLPARLRARGSEIAMQINPVNAPLREVPGIPGVDDPQMITLRTAKYWGPRPRMLSVSFLESAPADLRARIVSHLNAWSAAAGITFAETSGVGELRISRGPGGYYSYLGTDITLIPQNRQTMNLQGFTMNTPESEYRRVVRHEAGHTLGFPHEHMRKALVDRIDPQKAYVYFARTQGWDKAMVDQQVLTPLDGFSIIGTEPDQDSIMCYQLPGSITYDGQPIRGGTDINPTDFAFAGTIYPKSIASATGAGVTAVADEDDWDPTEDVLAPV